MITLCGLQTTLQRLIAINDKEKESNRKHIEVVICTELQKFIYLSIKDFVVNKKKGYNVIVSFGQPYNNDSVLLSNNTYEKLMYDYWSKYPCFMLDKTSCILCNINENCCYFYDDRKSAIKNIKNKIDSAILLSFCECKKNFIFDNESICLECNLRLQPSNNKKHFCVICQQINYCSTIYLNCCNNYIHKSCLIKLINYSTQCPLCRSPVYIQE